MASYLYSGTRKIIRRHKNLFSLYILQTCVIDILKALLYCIGIYVVLSCVIALANLSSVLILYDGTGLLAFLQLFIGVWVAITHPHLFIIEISMHYSYASFFISTYPVLCFSIFSIVCLVFLFVEDCNRILHIGSFLVQIGSFLNDVLLFMWSIVQEIYDNILSSIFSFFLAHNIHKVFIKCLTWLRFSRYYACIPYDGTPFFFYPYYHSDQSRFFSLLYHNAHDPSSIYHTLESFIHTETTSPLLPKIYNQFIHVLKLIQKYNVDLNISLLETLHNYYSPVNFREHEHSSLLHTMLHLAQCEKLTATNIPFILRSLTSHENIRYLLTHISEDHMREELIQHLIDNNTNVGSEVFQVFLTSISCAYTRCLDELEKSIEDMEPSALALPFVPAT